MASKKASEAPKPGGSAPDPTSVINQEFAFVCSSLGLDLPGFDLLAASASQDDRRTLTEARDLALLAFADRNHQLLAARVELMYFKGLLYGLTPLARRDFTIQKARVQGLLKGNSSRQKLPIDDAQLLKEISDLIAKGDSKLDAKARIRARYGVTSQCLNGRLRSIATKKAKGG